MANPQPVSAPMAAPGGKSPEAFRTISEVASELDLPQHVLRFWETRFAVIRPLKRNGGRRYYRPEDVALLRQIRDLLRDKGYTIKGVQKLLRQGGSARLAPAADEGAASLASAEAALEEYHAQSNVTPGNATPGGPIPADPTPPERTAEAAPEESRIAPELSPATQSELQSVLAELESLQALIRR